MVEVIWQSLLKSIFNLCILQISMIMGTVKLKILRFLKIYSLIGLLLTLLLNGEEFALKGLEEQSRA